MIIDHAFMTKHISVSQCGIHKHLQVLLPLLLEKSTHARQEREKKRILFEPVLLY